MKAEGTLSNLRADEVTAGGFGMRALALPGGFWSSWGINNFLTIRNAHSDPSSRMDLTE